MKAIEIPKGVPRSTFAKWIEVAHQTVVNLMARGMPDPKVDWLAALRWRLLDIDRGRSVDVQARRDYERERARKLQMENDKRAGELISLDEIAPIITQVPISVMEQTRTITNRVQNDFAVITDPLLIRERLQDEFRQMGETMARIAGKLADHYEERAAALEARKRKN